MNKALNLENSTHGIYKVLSRAKSLKTSDAHWNVKCILCRTESVKTSMQVTKHNKRCMCHHNPTKEEIKEKKEYHEFLSATQGVKLY